MRVWRGNHLWRDWVLTLIIASVPAVIVAVESEGVFLGLSTFAAGVGILRWVERRWSDEETPPQIEQKETRAGQPPEPLAIPRARRWWQGFLDRSAAKRRRRRHGGFRMTAHPRRCVHCRYDLTGLPDHHTCPECGRSYTFTDIDAYFDDPDAYRRALESDA
ncbi:MAG: hypothetical protein GY842_18490 [bacterium]|nr:hypothetical protein [bacterium]